MNGPTYGFRGIIPGERAEMKAARMTTCPKCNQFVDGVSEHQYFTRDVIAVECTDCRIRSIVGSDKWVQFPSLARLGEADWHEAYDKANQELGTIIDEVVAARQAKATEPIIRTLSPNEVWNKEESNPFETLSFSEHRCWHSDAPFIAMGGTVISSPNCPICQSLSEFTEDGRAQYLESQAAKPDEPKPMREMIHIDDHNFDLFMHVDDGCKEITIAPYGETFRYVDSGERTERGIRMFCLAPTDEVKTAEPEPSKIKFREFL